MSEKLPLMVMCNTRLYCRPCRESALFREQVVKNYIVPVGFDCPLGLPMTPDSVGMAARLTARRAVCATCPEHDTPQTCRLLNLGCGCSAQGAFQDLISAEHPAWPEGCLHRLAGPAAGG